MQAKLCATMANPIRLRILDVLATGEASVGEISERIGVAIGTVSRHLRGMRDANVLATRREGRAIYYRVRHHKIVECCHLVRQVLIEDLAEQGRIGEGLTAHERTTRPAR
ncbi:MAG: hypothetical protein A2Z12_08815 [Actinobacteria bacterium RBG_16_68_21]|nr:MAG: hypothetical protein A2Z12_08815 [Actinobacteria bacterium RBG_16_68_21]